MTKSILLIIALTLLTRATNAQSLYTISKDSTQIQLTLQGATHLASLPLKCLAQEYPNKTNHTSAGDSDQLLTPRQLHPGFYGCFDWHSCVHGHWMLVRLLKEFPSLPQSVQVRKAINETITPQNILIETNYFNTPLGKSFERTYGWAWLLKLDEELSTWNDVDGKQWHKTLQPLTKKIIDLWQAYLPKLTYPNRTGVHPNTAFGMAFALDYARTTGNKEFEKLLIQHSLRIFGKDKNAPATWEPDGTDFFSPALEEADLMRRVLPGKAFAEWLKNYLPAASIKHLQQLPIVSDRTDYQIVHLDGLCLSRSWCMLGIAQSLPQGDSRKKTFTRSAIQHLTTAIPQVVSGNYGGEHWLASFAVYAMMQ